MINNPMTMAAGCWRIKPTMACGSEAGCRDEEEVDCMAGQSAQRVGYGDGVRNGRCLDAARQKRGCRVAVGNLITGRRRIIQDCASAEKHRDGDRGPQCPASGEPRHRGRRRRKGRLSHRVGVASAAHRPATCANYNWLLLCFASFAVNLPELRKPYDLLVYLRALHLRNLRSVQGQPEQWPNFCYNSRTGEVA